MDRMFVYSWSTDSDDGGEHVRAFGVDGKGKSVCLRIDDFTPYVYVEIPPAAVNWQMIVDEAQRQLERLTVRMELMEKTHLYATRGEGKFLFCQCASRKQIGYISFHLKNNLVCGHRLQVHEECATSVLQLISIRKINVATWMQFRGDKVPDNEKITNCDNEFRVSWHGLRGSSETARVSPKVCAFDIEVNSTNITAMPSNKLGDVIFQISAVIEQFGVRRKILLTLDGDDLTDDQPILDGIETRVFETEEELLIGFIDLIKTERPNVLTGYNILMFDISYLMKRCDRYGLIEEFCGAGFNTRKQAALKTIKWSSSAYKNQEFEFVDWEGILILDLLPIIKRDYKLDNYKLDTVAQTLVGAEKDPVHYKEIFAAFREKKMARVGKYCVQDSNLCIDLLNHIHAWVSMAEMAVVCKTPMFDLYTKGQQFKIYCQVYDFCLRRNIVVTSNGYECAVGERFLGAYVMDPEPGQYENVVSLDFNSLYPSLIIAYNISYDTFVSSTTAAALKSDDYHLLEWDDHLGCEHDPKIIATSELTRQIDAIDVEIKALRTKRDASSKGKTGVEMRARYQAQIDKLKEQQKPFRIRRIEAKKGRVADCEDGEGNVISGKICAHRKYMFLKEHVKKGVLPTIIQNLLDSRKAVKKAQKTCAEEDGIVLDKKQLAYKVSANSMYGGLGVRRGYLPFMPGAMCVTFMGRESIKRAAQIADTDFGANRIYGDTDSMYMTFPALAGRPTHELWDHAIFVAAEISKRFPEAVNIEFENSIFRKFIILSKKRYMYSAVDRNGKGTGKIGRKGIVLARRDNAAITRDLYENVVKMAFSDKTSSKQEIADFIVEFLIDMFRGRFDPAMFVITKSIGAAEDCDEKSNRLGDYKVRPLPDNPVERARTLNGMTEREYAISCCPAQVQLAERLRKRGCPVDVGSRMEFVVLDRGKAKGKVGQKIEDLNYFLRRKQVMKLDLMYYLNAFINPLDQLLDVILGDCRFVAQQFDIMKARARVMDEIRAKRTRRIVSHYAFSHTTQNAQTFLAA